MARRRRKWTAKDKQFLVDNYQKMTNKELADHFNLTTGGIVYHLRKLGLKRNKHLARRGQCFERQQAQGRLTVKKNEVELVLDEKAP